MYYTMYSHQVNWPQLRQKKTPKLTKLPNCRRAHKTSQRWETLRYLQDISFSSVINARDLEHHRVVFLHRLWQRLAACVKHQCVTLQPARQWITKTHFSILVPVPQCLVATMMISPAIQFKHNYVNIPVEYRAMCRVHPSADLSNAGTFHAEWTAVPCHWNSRQRRSKPSPLVTNSNIGQHGQSIRNWSPWSKNVTRHPGNFFRTVNLSPLLYGYKVTPLYKLLLLFWMAGLLAQNGAI